VRYELVIVTAQEDDSNSELPWPGVIYKVPLCKNGLVMQHYFAEPTSSFGKGPRWLWRLRSALKGPTVSDEDYYSTSNLSSFEPLVFSDAQSFSVQSLVEQTRPRLQFRIQCATQTCVLEKASPLKTHSPFVTKDHDSLVITAGSAVISKQSGWVAAANVIWNSCHSSVVIADVLCHKILCKELLLDCCWPSTVACNDLLLVTAAHKPHEHFLCESRSHILRVFRHTDLRTDSNFPGSRNKQLVDV